LFSHVDILQVVPTVTCRFFPVTADTVALGLVVAATLGLVSSLAPADTSHKMSVVEGITGAGLSHGDPLRYNLRSLRVR